MTLLRRGLVLVSLILAACASPAETPSASSSEVMPLVDTSLTATLTDVECRLEGPRQLEAGQVEILVINQDSADRGGFQLLRIRESGTYDDLSTHVAEEQARIEAGEEPIGIPAYAFEVVGTLIESGTQERLTATLEDGVYAVVCADWAEGPSGRLLIVGPLTVGAGN